MAVAAHEKALKDARLSPQKQAESAKLAWHLRQIEGKIELRDYCPVKLTVALTQVSTLRGLIHKVLLSPFASGLPPA